MAEHETLERLQPWADKVAQESRNIPPDTSPEQLREREAEWYAEYYTLLGGVPGDRDWLITQEDMSPEVADAVLDKLKNLAGAQR